MPKLFVYSFQISALDGGQCKVGFGFGLPQVHNAGFKDVCHRICLCTVVPKQQVTMAVV